MNHVETYPRINAILEQINVGIVVIDRENIVRYWNPFMAIHSGIPTEDAEGRTLFSIYPELKEALKKSLPSRIRL